MLISPLSALYSVGMMVNGANGSTREQMEEMLGMKTEDLNLSLYSLRKALSRDEQGPLVQANSIWFSGNKGFTIHQNFLQTCADYYEADLLQIPFNGNMVREVNEWVGTRTKSFIPEIMVEAPEDAIAYIINAMSFEAGWENDKHRRKIHYGNFQLENGELKTVAYFSFVEENSIHTIVSIPRFTVTYESELSDSLKALGMTDAFDEGAADFSLLGTMESKKKAGKSVPYIGEFIHKTMLSVDEKGTKARAASAAGFETEDDIVQEYEKVTYSRPFVYAIIDRETMFPLFLGICNEPMAE